MATKKVLHTYKLEWTETHYCEAEVKAETIEQAEQLFFEGEIDGETDCSNYNKGSLTTAKID